MVSWSLVPTSLCFLSHNDVDSLCLSHCEETESPETVSQITPSLPVRYPGHSDTEVTKAPHLSYVLIFNASRHLNLNLWMCKRHVAIKARMRMSN